MCCRTAKTKKSRHALHADTLTFYFILSNYVEPDEYTENDMRQGDPIRDQDPHYGLSKYHLQRIACHISDKKWEENVLELCKSRFLRNCGVKFKLNCLTVQDKMFLKNNNAVCSIFDDNMFHLL